MTVQTDKGRTNGFFGEKVVFSVVIGVFEEGDVGFWWDRGFFG